MKPHRIELDRNRLRVDGVPLLVTERGIDNIVTHLPDFHEVTVTLFAEEVVLSGDTHDQDEPTPIYDEMVEGRESKFYPRNKLTIGDDVYLNYGGEWVPMDWASDLP